MRELLPHPHPVDLVMAREHLAPADVAAFVDKSLPLERRAELAEHLAECTTCREEVAACARLASSAPTVSRRANSRRIVLGVAAMLLLAVTLRSTGRRTTVADDVPTPIERSTVDMNRLTTISPTSGAVMARSQLRFVWRRDSQATGYHIFVNDANGKPVWSDEVADTALAPPDTARLVPGALHYWRVDALRADGTTAQSGDIVFRVVP